MIFLLSLIKSREHSSGKRFLMASGSKILSKEVLLSRIWGFDSDAGENNVEVYIAFLRKKLASIGSNVQISNIRRLGYHLEVDE